MATAEMAARSMSAAFGRALEAFSPRRDSTAGPRVSPAAPAAVAVGRGGGNAGDATPTAASGNQGAAPADGMRTNFRSPPISRLPVTRAHLLASKTR